MEMTQPVADKNLLDGINAGDKIEFEIRRTGAEVVISKIKKIGEAVKIDPAEIFKTNCAECHGERGEGAE